MIINSITELIGNTPILKLNKIQIPNNNTIFAKLEFRNVAGGIKDRFALYAFDKFIKSGKINKNSTIIEATAGNTGLGAVLLALEYGIKAIMVVPSKFSKEKQFLMKALGAKIINTPEEYGMQGASQKAQELLETIPNSFTLDQFKSDLNIQSHYFNTAKEIYQDLKNIDYFVCGAGSGGCLSGISLFLKEKIPSLKSVLCDPIGSIIGGGKAGEAHIEGIGNDFIPDIMRVDLIDEVIKISDQEAYNGVKMLSSIEGIMAGISSGACIMACLKLAQKIKNKTILTIFSDDLLKYFSREKELL